MIEFDCEGLAEVTYKEWCAAKAMTGIFAYRGGPNGARFMLYAIGTEQGGASILPPPSVLNIEVTLMYAERDGMTCHLCGGKVVTDPRSSDYDRLRPSLDHLNPRSRAGSHHPSNLRTSHLTCNKARKDRPLSESLTYNSVSRSVSAPVATHDRNWKGREGKWNRKNRREPVIHRLGPNARALPTMDDASGLIGGGR